MKKSANSLFASLSNSSIAQLTNEVKETLAFDLPFQIRHEFAAADLWNLQRQAKSRTQRRFI